MKTKPFTHKLRSTIVALATVSSMLMPMTIGAADNSVESVTSHEVTGGD